MTHLLWREETYLGLTAEYEKLTALIFKFKLMEFELKENLNLFKLKLFHKNERVKILLF